MLFKEHWNIARKKIGPILGLMCTNDIMGYAPSQFYTVPFLVYLACLEKAHREKSERNTMIFQLVAETCSNLMSFNDEFRKNVATKLSEFYSSPEKRTQDSVPSVQLLLA